jgi:hypothetical protein
MKGFYEKKRKLIQIPISGRIIAKNFILRYINPLEVGLMWQ